MSKQVANRDLQSLTSRPKSNGCSMPEGCVVCGGGGACRTLLPMKVDRAYVNVEKECEYKFFGTFNVRLPDSGWCPTEAPATDRYSDRLLLLMPRIRHRERKKLVSENLLHVVEVVQWDCQ